MVVLVEDEDLYVDVRVEGRSAEVKRSHCHVVNLLKLSHIMCLFERMRNLQKYLENFKLKYLLWSLTWDQLIVKSTSRPHLIKSNFKHFQQNSHRAHIKFRCIFLQLNPTNLASDRVNAEVARSVSLNNPIAHHRVPCPCQQELVNRAFG